MAKSSGFLEIPWQFYPVIFLVIASLDTITTAIGVARFGPSLESNPMLRAYIELAGLAAFVAIRIGLTFAVLLVFELARTKGMPLKSYKARYKFVIGLYLGVYIFCFFGAIVIDAIENGVF